MIKLKLFFLFTLIFFYSQSIIAQPDKVKPLQTLIIDPGHGGQDPGAKGTRESEANVALAISLKLGDTLAKAFPDLKIVFTRKTDILPGNLTNLVQSLRYRADL
ncbi:MAG: N-acetylmuramoyl-L-alanine amidase, partial [Chitinophagaceae bacterium]|nr:N-acetylmuramoyl-L-alanine amidase [Chitinophagaceae bacterium]